MAGSRRGRRLKPQLAHTPEWTPLNVNRFGGRPGLPKSCVLWQVAIITNSQIDDR